MTGEIEGSSTDNPLTLRCRLFGHSWTGPGPARETAGLVEAVAIECVWCGRTEERGL